MPDGDSRAPNERNWAAHPGDGWAQSFSDGSDTPCPRCGLHILTGDVVIASGYSEDPIVWICRRHSNLAVDREVFKNE